MTTLHASAVAVDGRAALIVGPSGSGKSSLAVEMIAQGGMLVSDDRTQVVRSDGQLLLSAPEAIQGKIEARGVGILKSPSVDACAALIVDLSQIEKDRLPAQRTRDIEGVTLPLLYKVESPAFAAMLLVYLKGERLA